jgi:hypothetical protein
MSLEHDIETIKEYTQWKAVRQDTSPEAFVKDRAQQTAYERLTKGIEFIEGTAQAIESEVGHFYMNEGQVEHIYNLLTGEIA